ncbi:unnamed protein product, partial [Closterium sp. Yama58-4]
VLAVALGVLWQQYRSVFGRPAPPKQEELKATLGAAGLPSVYARMLLGVEQMREMSPISAPFKEQRRELYAILPSAVRRRLAKRLKQRSKRHIDGAIARDLRGVVGDILKWAVPLAERTEVWNGDKSFGAQRRARAHRTLLVETLHYCDKDKFEAVLVELLTSFSLVTLHAKRPHPPSKARPPSAPIRRKQPGSAEPKNQAASRPSTAPAFPPSASAPTFVNSNSISNGYGNSEGNSNSNDNSGTTGTAYAKSQSVSALPAAAAAAAPASAAAAPARPPPMARAISITDAPDGGIRQPRTSPYHSGPPSSPRAGPASRAGPPGPAPMARSASSAPPPMARTAAETPPTGPAMPRPASHSRPGPGPAPGPGGPRGNQTGPRPRPGAGPGPRPSPGQAMPGRGGMGPRAGIPPNQVYRPSPASPVLDDIDGMPIRRSGGNVSAGQRQKIQQREWLKREVMQQGGSHAMG